MKNKKIDRNSLFECRGRAPDKATAKQRFHAFHITRGLEIQMAGSLATFGFSADEFSLVPLITELAPIPWTPKRTRILARRVFHGQSIHRRASSHVVPLPLSLKQSALACA